MGKPRTHSREDSLTGTQECYVWVGDGGRVVGLDGDGGGVKVAALSVSVGGHRDLGRKEG